MKSLQGFCLDYGIGIKSERIDESPHDELLDADHYRCALSFKKRSASFCLSLPYTAPTDPKPWDLIYFIFERSPQRYRFQKNLWLSVYGYEDDKRGDKLYRAAELYYLKLRRLLGADVFKKAYTVFCDSFCSEDLPA